MRSEQLSDHIKKVIIEINTNLQDPNNMKHNKEFDHRKIIKEEDDAVSGLQQREPVCHNDGN
jgi:hypothetical protein